MIYGSRQAEFMETKYNSRIHRYGTSVFGKIVVNIYKSINNNNKMFLYAVNYNFIRHAKCFLASKAGLFNFFCCMPCIINSCMEEV